MLSKILIDVDDQGSATINIALPQSDYPTVNSSRLDVKDKLVKRFLEGGMFCLISRTNDNNDAEIHSMSSLDILENIKMIYGSLCKTEDSLNDFNKTIEKLYSILSDISGEKSS